MTLEEVYQFYGNATKAAEAVNVSRQTFHTWIRRGIIPYNQQQRYEKLSNGELTAKKYPEKANEDGKQLLFPQFRYYSDSFGMCDVHSLTYLSGREPRIIFYCPENRQLKFSSFRPDFLMQSTHLKDSNGKVIYEKDIIRIDKQEETLASIYDFGLLVKIREGKNIAILGNIFEGGK